jgi:hypothetical protein
VPILDAANKRILYIHVPKTGGSSVERMLSTLGRLTFTQPTASSRFPCTPQHWHGEVLKNLFGDGAEFSSVFMTVRHPFTRLESEYRYRVGHYSRLSFLIPSFGRWVRNAFKSYEKNPYVYGNHIRPQVAFDVFNPTVFKLEDGLQAVPQHLVKLLGLSTVPEIQHLNETSKQRRFGWSDRLEKQVRQFYQQDFDRFGYS